MFYLHFIFYAQAPELHINYYCFLPIYYDFKVAMLGPLLRFTTTKHSTLYF